LFDDVIFVNSQFGDSQIEKAEAEVLGFVMVLLL
jgi:hypothetical protein